MTEPIIIEQTFDVSADIIWQAITNKEQMKLWYFDIADFKPEPGFQFSFEGNDGETVFVHLCTIEEVVTNKKLSHTWCYKGYEGQSKVSFELFEEGKQTRLRLTHEGLETFSQSNPSFARKNFEAGWKHIIQTSLPDFIKNKISNSD